MHLDAQPFGKTDGPIDELVRFVVPGGRRQPLVSAAEKTPSGYPFDEEWDAAREAHAAYLASRTEKNFQDLIFKIALARDLQYGAIRRCALRNHGLHNAMVSLSMRYSVQRP